MLNSNVSKDTIDLFKETLSMVKESEKKLNNIINNKLRRRGVVVLNPTLHYVFIEVSSIELELLEKDKNKVDNFILHHLGIPDVKILMSGISKLDEYNAKKVVPSYVKPFPPDASKSKREEFRLVFPTMYYCYSSKEPFEVKYGIIKHESADSAFKCAMSTIGYPEYGIIVKGNVDIDKLTKIKYYEYDNTDEGKAISSR